MSPARARAGVLDPSPLADPRVPDEHLEHALSALAKAAREQDPWVKEYASGYVESQSGESIVRTYLRLLELGGCSPEAVDILDAGCGLGLVLVAYGLRGARRLRGVDALPEVGEACPGIPTAASQGNRLGAMSR
jgi:hypothetical protein